MSLFGCNLFFQESSFQKDEMLALHSQDERAP